MYIQDHLGKDAEHRIRTWLDRPDDGYDFMRINDQMTGFRGSSNICDFTLHKDGILYYIESKATWKHRFPFSMLTKDQHDGLFEKSQLRGSMGIVIVLFADVHRAIIINIQDIVKLEQLGKKSLNIDKIDKWGIPYTEIQTVPSRKKVWDYTGDFVIK